MIIYDDKNRELGHFLEEEAGFEINTLNLPAPWEYIYENQDILVKMDERGPVYAQEKPPQGITILKRENGQKFSNWGVWIKKKESREVFTNFFRPLPDGTDPKREPEQYYARFYPYKAEYLVRHQGLAVKTEFVIPKEGTEIVMRLSVHNEQKEKTQIKLFPFFVPYLNKMQLAPWDKYEWYLKSGVGTDETCLFWSQLLSPVSDGSERRCAILRTDSEALKATEISLEKFVGAGWLDCPEAVMDGNLRMQGMPQQKFGTYEKENAIYAYPPVYASEYEWTLDAGERKTLTQVISVFENQQTGWLAPAQKVNAQKKYFHSFAFEKIQEEQQEYYARLFHINRVKTGDYLQDNYFNSWLPLQLKWVASLDRGWPSGMRGTRDSAQDYTALLYLEPEKTLPILRMIFSCQRRDGWLPRQYSAAGRKGQHDLRGHVDAGAFVIEFLYQYLAHTGDIELLSQKERWLDSEETSTILDHATQIMSYYMGTDHIGEHGLCKVGEGDWLDSVNRAGVKGRGESVMVSEQFIMCATYMSEILDIAGCDACQKAEYEKAAQQMRRNLYQYALNEKGFFSGTFSDYGYWIFSEKDPDGEERPYGPANWYAIISGIVEGNDAERVLSICDRLRSKQGYRLYWPPLGAKPMEGVGRAATGDAPAGFAENGNVYNHGSQGFLARALAALGKGDALWEVLDWMLPVNQQKHSCLDTLTAPYAIVNCWQELPIFNGRGLFSFLTGSVAMAERCVYEWIFGIQPTLNGLVIDPCIPSGKKEMTAQFMFRGQQIKLTILNPEKKCSGLLKLRLNGKEIRRKTKKLFGEDEVFYITPGELKDGVNEVIAIL